MSESYEIRIRKEALKFAASHMTVFRDGTKESLHGHQYTPTLTSGVKDVSFKKTILFSEIKSAMKKIATLWDEKVLLATENPHFKLKSHSKKSIDFNLCGKQYLLPSDEIILLPVDNITCENLAKSYFEFLKMELDWLHDKNIRSVSVYIEESPGQGAAYLYAK